MSKVFTGSIAEFLLGGIFMKKKLLMMICACALSGALLAGCGSESATDGPDTGIDDIEDDYDEDDLTGYDEDYDQPVISEYEVQELLSGLIGEWTDADAGMDPTYLNIYCNGHTYNYDLEDMSLLGSVSGRIEITTEDHPDGTASYWYTFYDENGDIWESFAADLDDMNPTDIYSGQDGALHFVRSDMAVSEPVGEGRGDVSPYYFLGIWGVDDGSYWMQITDEGDGSYHVHIQSMIVDNIGYIWEYYTYFDDDSEFLFCDDGEMWECEMIDPEQENQYLVYDDGSVNFYFVDGGICWGDHNDPSHQSVVFEYRSDN